MGKITDVLYNKQNKSNEAVNRHGSDEVVYSMFIVGIILVKYYTVYFYYIIIYFLTLIGNGLTSLRTKISPSKVAFCGLSEVFINF